MLFQVLSVATKTNRKFSKFINFAGLFLRPDSSLILSTLNQWEGRGVGHGAGGAKCVNSTSALSNGDVTAILRTDWKAGK